eukprot:scaffold23961_cov131-Isochrysis_galbana.AAC.15
MPKWSSSALSVGTLAPPEPHTRLGHGRGGMVRHTWRRRVSVEAESGARAWRAPGRARSCGLEPAQTQAPTSWCGKA